MRDNWHIGTTWDHYELDGLVIVGIDALLREPRTIDP
jgi:hypothetical protein